MSDEYVYVRQYNAKSGRYDVIVLSPFMFNEILASMKFTDGVYVTELLPMKDVKKNYFIFIFQKGSKREFKTDIDIVKPSIYKKPWYHTRQFIRI